MEGSATGILPLSSCPGAAGEEQKGMGLAEPPQMLVQPLLPASPFPQQKGGRCVIVLTKHLLIAAMYSSRARCLSSFHFRNFAQATRASPDAYTTTDAGR